jgi:hypothetical protein
LPVSFFIEEVFDVEGYFKSYQHLLVANLVDLRSIIMDTDQTGFGMVTTLRLLFHVGRCIFFNQMVVALTAEGFG